MQLSIRHHPRALARLVWVALLGIGLFLSACREDEDDCIGIAPVEADFIVGLDFAIDTVDGIVPLDTFREGTFVEFQANTTSLEKYQWRLQRDPQVFEGDYQRILFDEGTASNVEVTLVADDRDGRPDLCRTEAEQVDSITKTITIIPIEQSAILGRYRGYRTSAPDDVFEIEIKLREGSTNFYEMTNFPNGCTRLGSVSPFRVFPLHRHLLFPGGGVTSSDDCPVPGGFGVLDEDHKVFTMDFEIYVRATNSLLSDSFIATKIE